MAEREEAMGKATIRLPLTLLKDAKHYAVDQDLDLQEVVVEALRAFLAKKSKRPA